MLLVRSKLTRSKSLLATSLGAGIAPDNLRRLTEGSQKCLTHPAAINKTSFPRDDINRMMALLYHQPCGFETKLLNRLGGSLSRFGLKGTTELPRAETCHSSQFVDRQ